MAMKFPGNCLLIAILASCKPGNVLQWKRNASGRMHVYWKDQYGHAWEFYKKGASKRTYLQNAFYVGEIKRVG
jgi:hypothetical protein